MASDLSEAQWKALADRDKSGGSPGEESSCTEDGKQHSEAAAESWLNEIAESVVPGETGTLYVLPPETLSALQEHMAGHSGCLLSWSYREDGKIAVLLPPS